MDVESKSWPEFLGKNAKEVEQQLKAQGFQPEIKPEGAPCTRDFRIHRVRLFVNDKNEIVQTPHVG